MTMHLVDQLLDELSQRFGRPRPQIDDATLAQLVAQPWPGNVRELANTLEAAMIVSTGDRLILPSRVRAVPIQATQAEAIPSFEQATRELLARTLRACNGKIYGPGGAAELLELNPATLQGKLRKLGMSRLDYVDA